MKQKLILQSIVFNKEYFTKAQVKQWILKNNYVLMKNKEPIKKYGNQLRVRQKNPNLFKTGSYRTKIVKPKKIMFVFGKLK